MCPASTTEPSEKSNETAMLDNASRTVDLVGCSASDLASFLLQHRFQNDALATATFLLECTSALPNAEDLSAQLLLGGGTHDNNNDYVVVETEPQHPENDKDTTTCSTLGTVVSEPTELSMTTPRGKFHWTLHERGMRFVKHNHNNKSSNDELHISPDMVQHVVVFPKPQDCRNVKKPSTHCGGDMVLLCFKEAISFNNNNKSLSQVCFQLPQDSSWNDPVVPLIRLCDSLSLQGLSDVVRVFHPQHASVVSSNNPNNNNNNNNNNTDGYYRFRSHSQHGTSTTTSGMPFVQCYHGVQDGVVYPLREGLLFFKPPLFLHRSRLHSIVCGNGGSRYVDLTLTYDEEQHELQFTNIHREELPVLNEYIHRTLIPAMQQDVEHAADTTNVDSPRRNDTVEAIAVAGQQTCSSHDERVPEAAAAGGGHIPPSKRKATEAASQVNRSQVNQQSDDESEVTSDEEYRTDDASNDSAEETDEEGDMEDASRDELDGRGEETESEDDDESKSNKKARYS